MREDRTSDAELEAGTVSAAMCLDCWVGPRSPAFGTPDSVIGASPAVVGQLPYSQYLAMTNPIAGRFHAVRQFALR